MALEYRKSGTFSLSKVFGYTVLRAAGGRARTARCICMPALILFALGCYRTQPHWVRPFSRGLRKSVADAGISKVGSTGRRPLYIAAGAAAA